MKGILTISSRSPITLDGIDVGNFLEITLDCPPEHLWYRARMIMLKISTIPEDVVILEARSRLMSTLRRQRDESVRVANGTSFMWKCFNNR